MPHRAIPRSRAGCFGNSTSTSIPNHKALAPIALDNWVAKDRYGITFHESAMTLVWDRRQLVKRAESWGDLLRPELVGKLSFYDSFYFSLFTFACMKAACRRQARYCTPDAQRRTWARCSTTPSAKRTGAPLVADRQKMLQDLLQGNFAAGNGHSVTMLPARRRSRMCSVSSRRKPIASMSQLMWVIPADTPNAELAETAIDFLLSRECRLPSLVAARAPLTRRGARSKLPRKTRPGRGRIHRPTSSSATALLPLRGLFQGLGRDPEGVEG